MVCEISLFSSAQSIMHNDWRQSGMPIHLCWYLLQRWLLGFGMQFSSFM
jgi:hypothetical protein